MSHDQLRMINARAGSDWRDDVLDTETSYDLAAALRSLLDWCREHTGPTDANSPHALLVTAAAVLRRYDEGEPI